MSIAIVYLVLLSICLVSVWIVFNDRDPVHNVAALLSGTIAVVWLFIITPLLIQLPLAIASLFFFQSIATFFSDHHDYRPQSDRHFD